MTDDLFLYEQAYNYVLDRIRKGELRPGDRVPSEKELAERFEVSRITSKRALQLLAEDRLVERRRGKGSFVAQQLAPLAELPAPGRVRPGERGRSAACLGFVLPEAAESYGLDLLNAIEERAEEHGYHLVLRRTLGVQSEEERAVDALVGGDVVDGLVVLPVHGEFYNKVLLRLVLEDYPLVLVDRYLPGIEACAVHTDNAEAARVLTSRLLDQGHRELAFLSPPVQHTSSIEDRLSGFRAALAGHGLQAPPDRCFTECHSTLPRSHTDAERAADLDGIRAFVERESAVTAFVACEYNIAVLLWQVLGERDELADRTIACFDLPDEPYPRLPFAHIRQDQREMGRIAVDLLVAQLNGESVPARSIAPFALVDGLTAI